MSGTPTVGHATRGTRWQEREIAAARPNASAMAALHAPRRRRFSLLTCLEHNEVYFGSHSATLFPEKEHESILGLHGERLPGRLMVSSGGLVFEPDDQSAPLLRVALKDVPRPLFEWAAKPPRPAGIGVEAKAIR